jgi:hypothetical protein
MMKKVNENTKWNEIKETAKELGINPIGIKKPLLIETINNKIDELEKAEKKNEPKKKWYEVEEVPVQINDIAEVVNRDFLLGRRLIVTEYSNKPGFVRGYMINEKTGAYMKTLGSYKITQIKKVDLQLPMVITN